MSLHSWAGSGAFQRTPDGIWHAVARDQRNALVAIVLDSQGKVTQTR